MQQWDCSSHKCALVSVMWTISSSFVWRTNDSKRGNPINTRLDSYTSLNKVWWRHQVCWNIPVLGLHPKAPNKWLCFYKNVKKIDEFQHSREENVMNSVQLPDNFLTMILAWSTEHIHFFSSSLPSSPLPFSHLLSFSLSFTYQQEVLHKGFSLLQKAVFPAAASRSGFL